MTLANLTISAPSELAESTRAPRQMARGLHHSGRGDGVDRSQLP